ncbi:LRRC4B [Branchiostoma lanceolatum]|uniref:LRRC4B protein n=1 Tax=Branchiostoma lanceolatum TaxID=7740 RepID=A0A8K0EP22_BRALA|nr:LRRC4B [Branchiostoma lanceolatum]
MSYSTVRVVLLAVLWRSVELLPCPKSCSCGGTYNNPDHTVSCNNNGLAYIPDGIPLGANTLNLRGNILARLHPGPFRRLHDLKTLDLSANKIRNIADDTFVGLLRLETLNLSANMLTSVSSSLFTGLRNLRTLLLSKNPIVCIGKEAFAPIPFLRSLDLERLTHLRALSRKTFAGLHRLINLNMVGSNLMAVPYMQYLYGLEKLNLSNNNLTVITASNFQGLSHLRILVLSSNRLTQIEQNSFDDLTALSELNLSNNSLKTLPFGLFSRMTSLTKVNLRDNQWQCTCEITWLARWLRENIREKARDLCGMCAYPVSMQYSSLCEAPLDKLKCLPPQIIDQRGSVNVSTGQTATLRCRASREADVGWITPNGTKVKRGSFRVRIKLTHDNTLNITNTSSADAGKYRCVAKNQAGVTTLDTILNVTGSILPIASATEMPVEEDALDDRLDPRICTVDSKIFNTQEDDIDLQSDQKSIPLPAPTRDSSDNSNRRTEPTTVNVKNSPVSGNSRGSFISYYRKYIIASVSSVVALGVLVFVIFCLTKKCSKWRRKRKIVRERWDRARKTCARGPNCLKGTEKEEPNELPDVYSACNGGGVLAYPIEETIV